MKVKDKNLSISSYYAIKSDVYIFVTETKECLGSLASYSNEHEDTLISAKKCSKMWSAHKNENVTFIFPEQKFLVVEIGTCSMLQYDENVFVQHDAGHKTPYSFMVERECYKIIFANDLQVLSGWIYLRNWYEIDKIL